MIKEESNLQVRSIYETYALCNLLFSGQTRLQETVQV